MLLFYFCFVLIVDHHDDDEDLFDLSEENNDAKNGDELYEGDGIELYQVRVPGSHLTSRVRRRMMVDMKRGRRMRMRTRMIVDKTRRRRWRKRMRMIEDKTRRRRRRWRMTATSPDLLLSLILP